MILHSIFKGSEAIILSELLVKENKTLVYIAHDEGSLAAIKQNLEIIVPDQKVHILPDWDCLPYDRVSPSCQVLRNRLSVLSQILHDEGNKIILLSVGSFLRKLPPKEVVSNATLVLSEKKKIQHRQILDFLYEAGFNRSPTADNVGDFAARGGIIDIVIDEFLGYRLEFFGEELDSIRLFDPESQLSSKKVNDIVITAVNEVILNTKFIDNFKRNYKAKFGLADDHIYEAISLGKKYTGMEHWLPLFYSKLDSLFDYLPSDIKLITDHLFAAALKEKGDDIEKYYNSRLTLNFDKHYKPLLPSELYDISEDENNVDSITLSPFKSVEDEDRFCTIPDFYVLTKGKKETPFDLLKQHITEARNKAAKSKMPQKRYVICCFTMGSRDRVMKMLESYDFHNIALESWEDKKRVKGKTIGALIYPLEKGFSDGNYVYISEQDLLGERLSRVQAKKRRSSKKFIQALDKLSKGEYVVHIEHGIGQFEGLETLKANGAKHDFIKLNYAENNKLYIPVENLDLITKYSSSLSEVTLDKLGSEGWKNKKKKLKKKVQIAAEQLINNAATREVREGIYMQADAQIYDTFCTGFPYVETEDQACAIEDVQNDFKSSRTMDRLICGDVGFGKTEVALRAAAIAVGNQERSFQVAVIVPTTLLARQHFQEFSKRFANLSIKVKQLSKFVSYTESKKTKQEMQDGNVDIVIGTHALLAKDIKFKNLGLVIIDEEQKFGVAQKEKLKQIRNNTHFLTLSATPIPRTLQMSLSGIKELSLIATPPVDRLPVKTFILPFDPLVLRDAILRENFRGGRVFYISPRISYLQDIGKKLTQIVPEVKFKIAHGGMTGTELDAIMNEFYDGKFDVLLSTTIIESGLDIPMANTMIVDRADMFGLAQLYQIRGRIGRGKAKAYAYLTYPQGKVLNKIAQQRLEIIQSMEELGSGFNISTHDMDIRGYGNLVGDEQSGHIKDVGIELYQQLLQEEIDKLKGQQVSENWSPVLNVGVSIQIPENYVQDNELRLSLYRRIANLIDEEEVDSFASELIDRFGSLPSEVEHLLSIIKLKQIAKQKNISKVDCGERAIVVTFRDGVPYSRENVLSYLAASDGAVKLRPDGSLLVLSSFQSQDKLLIGIKRILSSL